jgi:hypothetical protein
MFGILGFRLAFAMVAFAGSFIAMYPATPRDTASDNYFGTHVPDPYRWLERINDPKTKQSRGHRPERKFYGLPGQSHTSVERRA